MSNPEDKKPKGIMKHDDDPDRRAHRRSISFKSMASVVVYNENSSPDKQVEPTEQAIQQLSSDSLLQISSGVQSRREQEFNLLTEVSEEQKQSEHKPPTTLRRDASPNKDQIILSPAVIEEVPDRNDEIRQRLENLTKRRSMAPSLNANLSAPPIIAEPPKEVVIAERPSEQKPTESVGKRLSDAYRRGLRKERMVLNEEETKSIQKEQVELDNPSNNRKRLDMMKTNPQMFKQRQTMNIKEMQEMFMMNDSDEKLGSYKSPIRQLEERKIAEPNHVPGQSRITLGIRDVERMLQADSDEKNQGSFQKSPSFKKNITENPILNKYMREQPAQHRSPLKQTDYPQKRMKVISHLNELLESRPQLTDSKTRPTKNLHLHNKRLQLNTRITSLNEQLNNSQKKSKYLSDSIRVLKTEISGLVQHVDIAKMLNMLLGVKSIRFYPDVQLRAMDQGGEKIDYYVELSLNHEVLVKIKKKVGKQPDIRIANTILSDQQTGLLNAKAIATIMKGTFLRNCNHNPLFESVIFLRNQYTSLCNLQKQLTFFNQMTEVRSMILSSTNDRLTIVIPSRRDDSQLELKIDLGSWNWTQHVRAVIDDHQDQVNMYQAACKPGHFFLVEFLSKLFKKVI